MIGLVLISHGSLAAGMREAAEMILGEQKNLIVLGLYPGDTVETFTEKLETAVRFFKDADSVLILTDIPSGTPSNTANRMVLGGQARYLSGCNLSMLLEVLACRKDDPIDEVVRQALASARESILDSRDLLERLGR